MSLSKIQIAFLSVIWIVLDFLTKNMVENKSYIITHSLHLRLAREYPKYQTVIPSKTTNRFHIDRNAILNAVKRIKILSNEKTNGIKLNVATNQLTISTNHPALGQANETLPIAYEGKATEIGFNAKYLIESLSVLNETDVTFEFNNELSPVVIKADDLPEFLGIIMPLKL